jgi:hypothetical protein
MVIAHGGSRDRARARAEIQANDLSVTTLTDTPVEAQVMKNDSGHKYAIKVTNAVVTTGTGSVDFDDASVTYTPGGGESGSPTVTYTITDRYGNTDTAILTINII